MPHLVIEITNGLLPTPRSSSCLLQALGDIHAEFARHGYAKEEDMKSRVVVADTALAGANASAEFIVATLSMTRPRPEPIQRAMGELVHARLERFIEEGDSACSWQCCVFFRYVGSDGYIKSASKKIAP